MKKMLSIIILGFVALSAPQLITSAHASKVITLKDGSVLKGNVIELKNKVYRIKTKDLGEVRINENNILSIATKEQHKANTTQSSKTAKQQPTLQGLSSQINKGQLQQQVQQLQGTLLSDPSVIQEIQSLAQDPEIMALLSDQNFVNAITNMDTQALENDPKLKQLMNNPKMKRMMDLMMQKVSTMPR